jgi:hypothetical protein
MRQLNKEIWPYKVSINESTNRFRIIEIETWLKETLNEYGSKWTPVYHISATDYYFREEKNAVWFALKWL